MTATPYNPLGSSQPYEPASLAHHVPASGQSRTPLTCTPKRLPPNLVEEGARCATLANPANAPLFGDLWRDFRIKPTPQRIALLTNNKWPAAPQQFPVYFFDATASAISLTLSAANEWAKHCNKSFVRSFDPGSVCRVSYGPGGLWSYVGTDNQAIPANQQTMNLEGYTANTPWAEFLRGACHEFGHFLGCPHEHMRPELVARLDRRKVLRYFAQTQGWSRQETINQVLTPINDAALFQVPGMPAAGAVDETSIMCYQLPGELTIDGQPILGGVTINARDAAYMGLAYPKSVVTPTGQLRRLKATVIDAAGKQYRGELVEVE
jgi:hypothetical protein